MLGTLAFLLLPGHLPFLVLLSRTQGVLESITHFLSPGGCTCRSFSHSWLVLLALACSSTTSPRKPSSILPVCLQRLNASNLFQIPCSFSTPHACLLPGIQRSALDRQPLSQLQVVQNVRDRRAPKPPLTGRKPREGQGVRSGSRCIIAQRGPTVLYS